MDKYVKKETKEESKAGGHANEIVLKSWDGHCSTDLSEALKQL